MDQVNNDLCLNEALIHIEDKIIRISGKKLSNFGMPTPQRRGELSTDLIKELSYNIALLDKQDEYTMSHKRAVEVLDRCLQDNLKQSKVDGWCGSVIGRDFRQTLPVIERCTSAGEINACLKASYLWTKVEKLYLTTNMRVQLFSDVESGAYTQKLLEIGEGHLDTDQEASETSVYNSIDTVMSSDDTTNYPVEFLNCLDLSGVPSHKLELKVGVPVLLMRNLDVPRLCNGTRL
ncbi:ATP-dependent DNA helicase [Trichonephila clavipes]|uniref:ATP-dependent DNA helicase n=1 Tax=Trichonephila clavipes TaxID=2585209 RepID=A0A8X6VMM1_TRICX|nr:ATP-dependent DNA helicase [Trichonephila clavipes]